MDIRIFSLANRNDIRREMKTIGVDPYGVKLMLPKAIPFLLKLENIDSRAANILKQEMLSLDGEAAIPHGALNGGKRKTSALLIGNQKIFSKLSDKLQPQPFGLKRIASEIGFNNQKSSF